jgi:hypothetical protein
MAKGGFMSTFDSIEPFLIIQFRFYNGMRCRCFTSKDQVYTSKYML